MPDLSAVGDTFGFGSWNIGLGSIGNFVMWLLLSLLIVGSILGFIIWRFYRSQYKYNIEIIKVIGGTPAPASYDKAKIVRMGRAGDMLFFLLKAKKYIAPPELQSGRNKYCFWEREDGELINVNYENLDERMKKLGFKFIHSDMRMQRLGIEKNLQYRLQNESFWEKYGNQIMNVIFYVLMMVVLVVLFTQMGKLGDKLGSIAMQLDDRIQAYNKVPKPLDEEGASGVITSILPLLIIGGGT